MTTDKISNCASYFPLKNVHDVRQLFAFQLSSNEPDLVLLSIVAGSIENAMTKASDVNLIQSFKSSHSSSADESSDDKAEDNDDKSEFTTNANLKIEPQVDWHTIEALYGRFHAVLANLCDVSLLEKARESKAEQNGDLRRLIKHVADIIWNTLSKAQYKDRPHLQSIYSYLTGNKLDCFGVAFAVVAACQMLSLSGIHLALSEDHAWVVFGQDGTQTAEVTWHGKGNEDKRGQSVEINKAKTSWLYLAGQPVVCDRHMEVAALISSINPAINANYDSIEVGGIQQELLWLLYDSGYLKHYPMALGNLGDLEEISPSLGRPHCLRLFEEAIEVNRRIYNNHHVYPYTYLAGFYYRAKDFPQALSTWANAADVIKLYSYSKDDEEIYKEFMEIANELIPHVLKSNDSRVNSNPQCFADILRFYDGICRWEEGSSTPIMHIGWAKPMVSTCSKFESKVRQLVQFDSSTATAGDEADLDTNSEKILNNNYYEKYEETKPLKITSPQHSSRAEELVSDQKEIIDILSEYCTSKILNIDYLLGQSTQPFVDRKVTHSNRESLVKTSSPAVVEVVKDTNSEVKIDLRSAKMLGLKELLCADKLNTNAIQLQLTALSQLSAPGKHEGFSSGLQVNSQASEEAYSSRPKRSRRE